MEYVIDLLQIAKFEAKVIYEKSLVPSHVLNEIKADRKIEFLIYQYCEYLNKQGSRPAKLETLLNSLKATLKIEEDISKILVELLKNTKL